MEVYNDMIVINGEEAGTPNDFIIKKGSYMMKEYGTTGKLKYISKEDFEIKYKKIKKFGF